MENRTSGTNPEQHGFNIPRQNWSIADQADMYLTIVRYDRLKYGFCEKYGYRLGESALALKKCGDNETVIWDGVQTKAELKERYDKALEVALTQVPLDDRDKWITEFQRELNEVYDMHMALDLNMQ